jgi:hypothetical protein
MNSTSFRMVAVEASVEVPAEGYKQALLSPDGKSRAWILAPLPDGRHVLLLARRGKLADVFIYGDLETRGTLRWSRPAGIKPDDSMEFLWVETP